MSFGQSFAHVDDWFIVTDELADGPRVHFLALLQRDIEDLLVLPQHVGLGII